MNYTPILQKRKEDLIFMKQYPQRWPSEEAKNLVKKSSIVVYVLIFLLSSADFKVLSLQITWGSLI